MPRKREIKPKNYYEAFPERLREIMAENETTQQELSERLGKSRQAVGYYAEGSAGPDWKTLAAIAQYFHVSADWLLGLSEYRTTENNEKSIQATGIPEKFVNALGSIKDNRPDSFPLLQRLMGDENFIAALAIFAFLGDQVPLDNNVMFSDGFEMGGEKPRRRKGGPRNFVSSMVVRDGILLEIQEKILHAFRACFGEEKEIRPGCTSTETDNIQE